MPPSVSLVETPDRLAFCRHTQTPRATEARAAVQSLDTCGPLHGHEAVSRSNWEQDVLSLRARSTSRVGAVVPLHRLRNHHRGACVTDRHSISLSCSLSRFKAGSSPGGRKTDYGLVYLINASCRSDWVKRIFGGAAPISSAFPRLCQRHSAASTASMAASEDGWRVTLQNCKSSMRTIRSSKSIRA